LKQINDRMNSKNYTTTKSFKKSNNLVSKYCKTEEFDLADEDVVNREDTTNSQQENSTERHLQKDLKDHYITESPEIHRKTKLDPFYLNSSGHEYGTVKMRTSDDFEDDINLEMNEGEVIEFPDSTQG